MKKLILTFLITLCLTVTNILTVFCNEPATDATVPNNKKAEEDVPIEDSLQLSSSSAILMDATTGEILYEKNSRQKEFPASITKLMTVLLALESGKMGESFTFSHEAVFGIEPGSSHIAMDVGETMTMEQALYAIMLRSANEVSAGVAEHVNGTIEAFCQQMTKRAKELGAENTNFLNANGLHDENHYTTAYDMALIAKELLKFDQFRETMGTLQYDIPPTNKQTETRHLYAQHQMIKKPSIYYYEWAEGGKTGFTNEAQNTLVTYAKQGDTELIAVVFHCAGAEHYVDSKKLFDYGFDNFKTAKLLGAGEYQKTIKVTEKQGDKTIDIGTVTIQNNKDVYKTVPKDLDISAITQKLICDDTVFTPIDKDAILGSLVLSDGDELIDTIDLTATKAIPVSAETITKNEQKDVWSGRLKIAAKAISFSMIAFILLLCVTRTIGYYQRKKRRKKRREAYQADQRRRTYMIN